MDENPAKTINLDDTIGDLCRLKPKASVCQEQSPQNRIIEVYQSYEPVSLPAKVQALTPQIRNTDTFNRGYAPHHFSVPEESYTSGADSVD
nr:hypothetical protein [Salinimonas marina]